MHVSFLMRVRVQDFKTVYIAVIKNRPLINCIHVQCLELYHEQLKVQSH